MCAHDQLFHKHVPKVFTDNQISLKPTTTLTKADQWKAPNTTGMQPGQCKPRAPHQRILHHHLLSSRFDRGKIVRLSTLMVGTQQVHE
jgi:hypothetical protein